jgi:hypothetical protein
MRDFTNQARFNGITQREKARSRAFPEGLLDRRFSAGSGTAKKELARFSVLTIQSI